MKNSADLGGYYPPRPSASVDNTLLDLQNSSYPTQPHSIIAKHDLGRKPQYKIFIYNYETSTLLLKYSMLVNVFPLSQKAPKSNVF